MDFWEEIIKTNKMKNRKLVIRLTKRYTKEGTHYHVNLFEKSKSLLQTEPNGYKRLVTAVNILNLLKECYPKAEVRCQVIGAVMGLSNYEIRNETAKLEKKVLGDKVVTSKIY